MAGWPESLFVLMLPSLTRTFAALPMSGCPLPCGQGKGGQHGILSVGLVRMQVVVNGQTGQTHQQNPGWVMHAVSPRQAPAHKAAF